MKGFPGWCRSPSRTLASVSPKEPPGTGLKGKAAQGSQIWLCSLPHPPQKEAVPSMLGHQIGLLSLLWQDQDESTQQHSYRSVSLLMYLVYQQKGEWSRARGRWGCRNSMGGRMGVCSGWGKLSFGLTVG